MELENVFIQLESGAFVNPNQITTIKRGENGNWIAELNEGESILSLEKEDIEKIINPKELIYEWTIK